MLKHCKITALTITLIVSIIILTFGFVCYASAEILPNEKNIVSTSIHYVIRDDIGIYGHVNNAEGECYARVTLYLETGAYIVLVAPVSEDGTWLIRGWLNPVYFVVQIVNKPNPRMADHTVYDAMEIFINR